MQLRSLALALASAGLLSACGGGDSADTTTTTPTVPTTGGGTSTALSISGVAARGAALAGAAVSVKCATGTGQATTSSSGAYTVSVDAGALPCVLSATSSDAATVLHSVATGTTANITPLTELLVAQLVGSDPATFMSSIAATSLAGTLTSDALSAAQAAVVATLTAAGLDTSGIANPITDTLVAATTGSSGNGYDKVLDNLGTALAAAGTTLTELSTTVATTAAAASASPAVVAYENIETFSLAADLLLKPKATNCAALRSTTYRLLKVEPSVTTGASDALTTSETMVVDATALTATFSSDGGSQGWTATGACRYTTTEGADVMVSPSGVIVLRALVGSDDDTTSDPGKYRMMVALPAQSIAVGELAGSWNYLSWQPDENKVFGVQAATIAIGSDGALNSVKCEDDTLATATASCSAATTLLPRFSSNSTGGFDLASTDPADVWKSRAFAYRAGNGEMMLVIANAAGEITFATKTRTLGLPSVGFSWSLWNVTANVGGVAVDAVDAVTHTIVSLDTANNSFIRASTQGGGSTVTAPQTLFLSSGRDGYIHRVAASVTASDGTGVNVREMYALRLIGFGITAWYVPKSNTGSTSNARYGISVRQPS